MTTTTIAGTPALETLGTLEVVSPRSQRLVKSRHITPLSSLDGVTLGLFCNSKPNAQVLLDAVAEAIAQRVPLARIVRASKAIPSSAAPDDVYEQLAEECGAVIFASADCGSCTSWGIHDTIELEKRGVPSVCLVAHPFIPMAEAQSHALEYPGVRRAVFEGPIAGLPVEMVKEKGRIVADAVIAAFLAPVNG